MLISSKNTFPKTFINEELVKEKEVGLGLTEAGKQESHPRV